MRTAERSQFQDNQAQTNFWAAFLSEANVINTQLQAVAAGRDTPSEIQQLISQIDAYQKFGANFDQHRAGSLAPVSTMSCWAGRCLPIPRQPCMELTGIANGDTGDALAADQAQILAAGTGFTADANDVSGNNIPVGGGSYVGTATTVATATTPNGVAMGSIPVTTSPDIANGTGSGGGASVAAGSGSTGGQAGSEAGTGHGDHGELSQFAQHFGQHFDICRTPSSERESNASRPEPDGGAPRPLIQGVASPSVRGLASRARPRRESISSTGDFQLSAPERSKNHAPANAAYTDSGVAPLIYFDGVACHGALHGVVEIEADSSAS